MPEPNDHGSQGPPGVLPRGTYPVALLRWGEMDGTDGTALKKQAILDTIEEVGKIKAACRKIKLPYRTYYNWRRDDPDFREKSDAARALGMEMLLDDSEDFLLTDETPASRMFMLKSHRRHTYGDRQHVALTDAEGGPLTIVIERVTKAVTA